MNLSTSDAFPKEFLIELKGVEDHLAGRLTLLHSSDDFWCEVDIILKESGKIYHHVATLYGQKTDKEALENGMQALREAIQRK